MINNENRAFFLNELDGFHPNTGLVVLATTNHPEKLDSSILDRPSRFDRKYYFQLPADAERRAYIAKWNGELQPEMRVREESVARVVRDTQDFSFAYLKELFVTSMVQWMSSGGAGSMDEVLIGQTELLRSQMKTKKKKASGSSRK
jgi:ATP-dependent 26S proteasome regulatory subunit